MGESVAHHISLEHLKKVAGDEAETFHRTIRCFRQSSLKHLVKIISGPWDPFVTKVSHSFDGFVPCVDACQQMKLQSSRLVCINEHCTCEGVFSRRAQNTCRLRLILPVFQYRRKPLDVTEPVALEK